LEIEVRTQDGVRVVKLKGRLCIGSPLDRFNSTMAELLEQGHNKIILDLEELSMVDSSGIGMLMRYLTSSKQGGGGIRLYKPSKFTVQTLKMVGLLNLFRSFEDLPQAIASLQ
jgi:anti-sigma B factor antagonist